MDPVKFGPSESRFPVHTTKIPFSDQQKIFGFRILLCLFLQQFPLALSATQIFGGVQLLMMELQSYSVVRTRTVLYKAEKVEIRHAAKILLRSVHEFSHSLS